MSGLWPESILVWRSTWETSCRALFAQVEPTCSTRNRALVWSATRPGAQSPASRGADDEKLAGVARRVPVSPASADRLIGLPLPSDLLRSLYQPLLLAD